MKLRLISKNVFIKLDGRRIHHIRFLTKERRVPFLLVNLLIQI